MHRPWRALPFAVAALAAARTSAADPHEAIDRYEPPPRGSDWLANDSLDLRGRGRPSIGYVLTYARRPLVAFGRAPVEDLWLLHFGASFVVADRLRLSLGVPLELYAGGVAAGPFEAPPREEGVGDVHVSADVRLVGRHLQAFTAAIGASLFVPTGRKSQYASDGTLRARPRLLAAGDLGAFVWSAQAGAHVRERTEIVGGAAAGVRLARVFVVGPEIIASTPLDGASSAVEALFGGHVLVDRAGRIGLGVARGLTDGRGAAQLRAIFSLEWSPSADKPPRRDPREDARVDLPDADGDGIPDATDACPKVPGVKTDDPRTNGCPPDTDGDGVDDVHDACPTVPGIVTDDPATTGCPDRDRDHDGVPNEIDACPDDPGPRDVDPKRSGCPKAFVRESRIVIVDPIELGPGAELAQTPSNEAVLTALLAAALKVPETRRFRIEGHTDDRGDKRLGAARAEAVLKWLGDHGIDRARMRAVGVGPDKPIATNETEAGRAENRRIEVHLEP